MFIIYFNASQFIHSTIFFVIRKTLICLLFFGIHVQPYAQNTLIPYAEMNKINTYTLFPDSTLNRITFSDASTKTRSLTSVEKIGSIKDHIDLNCRYKPENNPLLLWKNDYPLTEEQIKNRAARKKKDESIIGSFLKNRTRKDNTAIIPSL